MKTQLKLLQFSLLIALSLNINAQQSCALSNLPTKDKVLLKLFWKDLREAIGKKDQQGLEKLCNLPITCSFCEKNLDNKPYVIINKQNFSQYKSQLFLSKNFKENVIKFEILDILQSNKEENFCTYTFSFPILKPVINGFEGKQGFIDIKKYGNKYKIKSAWQVP